ncbi:hypothetical protein KSF73_13325 [Burkholderiaceae bacterium DAT-1]|nr:hypothetical protein [Burkholderiaceae bacterium DAT-1]
MIDFKSLIDTLLRRGREEEDLGINTSSATLMLAELPRNESLQALSEIIQAIAELNRNGKVGLKERVRTVILMDDKAQPIAQLLTAVYRGTEIIESLTPRHVLPVLQSFYQELGVAYKLCIKQHEIAPMPAFAPHVELASLRTAEYYARQGLWSFVRYFQADRSIWRNLNRLYGNAESGGFQHKILQLHPSDARQDSLAGIYKRALLLRLAEPERRLPDHVWMLDRSLQTWSDLVSIDLQVRPRHHAFAVNIDSDQPAAQFRRNMVGPTYRYLDTSPLIAQLGSVIQVLENGQDSPDLGNVPDGEKSQVIAMLKDLMHIWSRDGGARTRLHERTLTSRHTIAAYGLLNVSHLLGQTSINGALRDGVEQGEWHVEDESTSGLGVSYRDRFDDRLCVGEIVAMRDTEHPRAAIGIVRRIVKSRDGKVRIGVEKLGAQTSLVALLDGELTLPALFSQEAPQANGERCLILPVAHHAVGRAFILSAGSHRYQIVLGKTFQSLPGVVLSAFTVTGKQE